MSDVIPFTRCDGNPENANMQAAWFIYSALVRFQSEVPEAKSNIFFQQAVIEAGNAYSFAMSAK